MSSGPSRQMRRNLLAGAAVAAIVAATPAHAQNINTLPAWDGSNAISSWGTPNTATYGETITPTTGQRNLSSFTFELGQLSGTPPQFQAFVYQWDGSKIVGPALFTSGIMTAPAGALLRRSRSRPAMSS